MPIYWKHIVIKITALLIGGLSAMWYVTPATLEIVLTAILDKLKLDLDIQH